MPTNPLIQPDELAAALQPSRDAPVLLDVRWQLGGPPGRDAYLAGHLPGAVFVDLDRELAAPPGGGGRHPLPASAAFQAAMRRCGVRGDRAVVVYDQRDTTSAARAWWLLGYHGHADVRVLDGGYDGWAARGLEVTTEVPDPPPGDFVSRPGRRPLLDAGRAAEVAHAGVLLDARAAARYRGEQEPVDPVAGHIPGARTSARPPSPSTCAYSAPWALGRHPRWGALERAPCRRERAPARPRPIRHRAGHQPHVRAGQRRVVRRIAGLGLPALAGAGLRLVALGDGAGRVGDPLAPRAGVQGGAVAGKLEGEHQVGGDHA